MPVIKKEKVTLPLCKVNPGKKHCQTETVYLPKTICQLPPEKQEKPHKVVHEDPQPTYRCG